MFDKTSTPKTQRKLASLGRARSLADRAAARTLFVGTGTPEPTLPPLDAGTHPCDDRCRYRALYESSQNTLGDLAAKHGAALGARAKIRKGVISVLRRHFPLATMDAERTGQRCEDATDDLLLARLDTLLTAERAHGAIEPALRHRIAVALGNAGIHVDPAQSMEAWVEQIEAHALTDTTPASPATEPVPEPVFSGFDEFPTADETPAPVTTPETGAFGQVPAVVFDDTPDWAAPTTEPDTTLTGQAQAATDTSAATVDLDGVEADDLTGLFGPDNDMQDFDGFGFEDFGDPEPITDPTFDLADEDPEQVDDMFDDFATADTVTSDTGTGEASAQATAETPADSEPAAAHQDRSLASMIVPAVPAVVAESTTEEAAATVKDPDPAIGFPVPASTVEPAEPAAPKTRTRSTEPANTPEETNVPAAAETEPADRAPARPNRSRRRRNKKVAEGQATLTGLTIKPEIVAQPTTRTRPQGRKAPRVKATTGPDTEAAATSSANVEDLAGVFDKMIADADRPVFTSDLLAVANGDSSVVAAWEDSRRQDNNAKVRFVPGKRRYAKLGALCVPYLEDNSNTSLWATCVQRLRGPKLYEAAVLLHNSIDQIVDWEVGDHCIELHANQARGLVGILAVMSNSVADGASRAELRRRVSKLISERLTLVAVLATAADSHQDIVDSIDMDADELGWEPKMPVVVARSWEWAADQGASSTLVLGG